MPRYGARILSVSIAAANAGTKLLSGPLRLLGWSMNDGAATQSLFTDTSAAAPTAGTIIASLTLFPGVYSVEWWFELTGAAGAADVDNVELRIGVTNIDQSVNPGAVGNYGPFTAQAVVSGGSLILAAIAIGNATAATTYKVKLVVTPVGDSQALVFDGGQEVARVHLGQGQVDNFVFPDGGVRILSQIAMQTVQGVVSGELWYYTESDYDEDYGKE